MNKTLTEKANSLLLHGSKKIAIIGHKNPDGDAVGACLGLYAYLKAQGHEASVVMPNDFPDFLKWLPGCEDLVIFEKDTTVVTQILKDAAIIFTLDFNALDRVGEMELILKNSRADFIMIDHHQQPQDYAVATYSDPSMSSTAEMVYHFIVGLGGQNNISPAIATNLYAGIMTDTGSFRFPATSSTTHRVIAHLMDCGANHSAIHEQIYDTNSPERMKLLGVALDHLVILPELRTAYMVLSQKELDAHHFKKEIRKDLLIIPFPYWGSFFQPFLLKTNRKGLPKFPFAVKALFP